MEINTKPIEIPSATMAATAVSYATPRKKKFPLQRGQAVAPMLRSGELSLCIVWIARAFNGTCLVCAVVGAPELSRIGVCAVRLP